MTWTDIVVGNMTDEQVEDQWKKMFGDGAGASSSDESPAQTANDSAV